MKEEMMKYYIQRHASGYLGNAPIWWCKGDAGYSAYLENAKIFTKEEAEKILGCDINKKSEKYKAYPCAFIDSIPHRVFDMQDFRELEQWLLINEGER
jgi:hypothetical protein